MSTMTAIEAMPYDLQVPMLKVLDAFQRDLREQLAVRREDFDKLQATVAQLARSQDRTEESRLDDREWEDVGLLDLIVRGQATQHAQRPSVFLALEIAAVIDRGDVRSLRRSARLRTFRCPYCGAKRTQGLLGRGLGRGPGVGCQMLLKVKDDYIYARRSAVRRRAQLRHAVRQGALRHRLRASTPAA
jgi:hypothetical protein